MNNILLIAQITSGLILTAVILIQSRGKGFARSWGGSASFTRRGLEKVVFRMTFVLAAIFIIVSILQMTL